MRKSLEEKVGLACLAVGAACFLSWFLVLTDLKLPDGFMPSATFAGLIFLGAGALLALRQDEAVLLTSLQEAAQLLASSVKGDIAKWTVAGKYQGTDIFVTIPKSSEHRRVSIEARVNKAIADDRIVYPTAKTSLRGGMLRYKTGGSYPKPEQWRAIFEELHTAQKLADSPGPRPLRETRFPFSVQLMENVWQTVLIGGIMLYLMFTLWGEIIRGAGNK